MEHTQLNAIGIIGGVGPRVDPLLLTRILDIELLHDRIRDQDSLPVLLAQCGGLIEDRTDYLGSLTSNFQLPNPAHGAARVARLLVAAGATVLAVPCHTFHAQPIFSRFKTELDDLQHVRIIHLIETALNDVIRKHPGSRYIGILSTTGSQRYQVFSKPIEEKGLKPIELSISEQEEIHRAIYDVKSCRDTTSGLQAARGIFETAITKLSKLGAEVVILGCTEISLANPRSLTDIPLLDSLDSLAHALVKEHLLRNDQSRPD